MLYVKFNDFGAYIIFLRSHEIEKTHLDLADLSDARALIFSIVATQRVGDSIALCHELAAHQTLPATAKSKAAHEKTAREVEKLVWNTMAAREKAFKADGIKIQRGILTAAIPEVLARAK